MVCPVADRVLHQRLVAREVPALTELYRTSSRVVWSAAFGATADRQAAEDVTQAVFVALWYHPGLYDPDRGALAPWLSTVARRKGIDWVRSEAAFRHRNLTIGLPHPPAVNPADHYGEAERRAEIHRAVASLPDNERVPIQLAFFGGHSYRAVAAKLQTPEGTVKSRIRAGLARLADPSFHIS